MNRKKKRQKEYKEYIPTVNRPESEHGGWYDIGMIGDDGKYMVLKGPFKIELGALEAVGYNKNYVIRHVSYDHKHKKYLWRWKKNRWIEYEKNKKRSNKSSKGFRRTK